MLDDDDGGGDDGGDVVETPLLGLEYSVMPFRVLRIFELAAGSATEADRSAAIGGQLDEQVREASKQSAYCNRWTATARGGGRAAPRPLLSVGVYSQLS